MVQKYYTRKEASELLGISEADVKQLQDERKIYGYRDGTDWKYKVEDIDGLPKDQLPSTSDEPLAEPEEAEPSDVLLSEVELGQSESGASGTVIGMDSVDKALESDIQLSESSDLQLAESDIGLASDAEPPKDEIGSKVSEFEELDLTLEQDLTLEDSQLASIPVEDGGSGSDIDLSGAELDDDDLVLGGSGTGSDITIGGDSGISLVDPADSGISLEEPLDLTGSGEESLELGEDDMISLTDDAPDLDAPTELKTDDDFLLTPLEDMGDEEDSESGSQVIALDDAEGDEAAALSPAMDMDAGGGMAAMLEEDLGAQPTDMMGAGLGMDVGAGAGMAAGPGAMTQGAPLYDSTMTLPEAPYSIWNILGLSLCAIFLVLCGMMMFDLMRNMWSWSGPYDLNSSMMDSLVDMIGW